MKNRLNLLKTLIYTLTLAVLSVSSCTQYSQSFSAEHGIARNTGTRHELGMAYDAARQWSSLNCGGRKFVVTELSGIQSLAAVSGTDTTRYRIVWFRARFDEPDGGLSFTDTLLFFTPDMRYWCESESGIVHFIRNCQK